ncbi:unnamed protein product [Amoebophrya sp. A120]|nr:unnamed protein product [Amoebophrya sp. A120]|eukprot:GSA120T00008762001.1
MTNDKRGKGRRQRPRKAQGPGRRRGAGARPRLSLLGPGAVARWPAIAWCLAGRGSPLVRRLPRLWLSCQPSARVAWVGRMGTPSEPFGWPPPARRWPGLHPGGLVGLSLIWSSDAPLALLFSPPGGDTRIEAAAPANSIVCASSGMAAGVHRFAPRCLWSQRPRLCRLQGGSLGGTLFRACE